MELQLEFAVLIGRGVAVAVIGGDGVIVLGDVGVFFVDGDVARFLFVVHVVAPAGKAWFAGIHAEIMPVVFRASAGKPLNNL